MWLVGDSPTVQLVMVLEWTGPNRRTTEWQVRPKSFAVTLGVVNDSADRDTFKLHFLVG